MGNGESKPQQVIKLHSDRPTYDFNAFEKLMKERPGIEDTKVFVICISGVHRSGKSFLLNLMKTYLDYCIKENTKTSWHSCAEAQIRGGRWARGEESVTHGIWMYMYPKLINERAILFMDCQGSADTLRSSETLDNLILFLGLQLSDVHILNVTQTMDTHAISRLSLCALHADDNKTGCLFRRNIVLVRNWPNPGEPKQLDDLIQEAEQPPVKKDLENIKSVFSNFEIIGLPFPGSCVNTASEESNITLQDVDKEFVGKAEQLFKRLFLDLSSDASTTGNELIERFKFFSARAVRKVKTQRQVFAEITINAAFQNSSEFFKARFDELDVERTHANLTLSQTEERLDDIYKETLQMFDNNPTLRKFQEKEIKMTIE